MMTEGHVAKDKVSIVLAVYNEEAIVRDAVNSLLKQEAWDFEVEILVVDGNSTDRTSKILKEMAEQNAGRIKYVFNEKRIAPAAFNLGIKEASGNYIAIFGSHAKYADNYLSVCLEEIHKTGAVGCSGTVIPRMEEDNQESELCLSILTSRIGVSGGSFRTRSSGFAESIPYGVFKKEVFDKVGWYDERLVRNQDNDMNARINKAGYKLYITDRTHAYYYPKSNLKALKKYAFNTGLWNAKSLKFGSYTLRLLHFVPFFFLLFNILLIATLVLSVIYDTYYLVLPLLLVYLLYWVLIVFETSKLRFEFKENRLAFPVAVYSFQLNYGFGTLKGFLSNR
ncbi:MAG TPA: hypothetical protein DCG19_07890 [Cryomorphaceae bacterium]|nr:hypothetical protein [Cryomorphaceae bacterium]